MYHDHDFDLIEQVIGASGSGKSSFINRLRGLTPDDEMLVNEAGEAVPNPLYATVGRGDHNCAAAVRLSR